MEEADPPECPVCLQPYDAVSAIPRVLTCGHTTCEVCLKELPNPFPNTIRCSICTVLVRCPNPPSSLPKNLDLLYFSTTLQNHRPKDHTIRRKNRDDQVPFPFTLKSWSCELSRKWSKWIVPKDFISIDKVTKDNDDGITFGSVFSSYENNNWTNICGLREEEAVGLVRVGIFSQGVEGSSFFRCSYESRIMTVISVMEEEKRNQLEQILKASHRVINVTKICGLWCNEDNNSVYILFQRFDSPTLIDWYKEERTNEKGKLNGDNIRGMAMIGREICEILSSFHSEGLVIGFLNPGCFIFNDFGGIYLNLFEIFNAGKGVAMAFKTCQQNLINDFKNKLFDEKLVFISPELLLRQFSKTRLDLDGGTFKYEVGYASDSWTLGCVLVWFIVGNCLIEVLRSLLHSSFIGLSNEDFDYPSMYMNTMEKISSLLDTKLGSEYTFLKEILLRCLDFNPKNRPAIFDLWNNCLREFDMIPQFDIGKLLKQEKKDKALGQFIILGELFWTDDEMEKDRVDGLLMKYENNELQGQGDLDISSMGKIKCRELRGHLDCVTALLIRDGFLFSSSYDKTIKVWSLQNFTCIHSFKGHEHRIMALVFVDGEERLCISGDYKGFICIWKADFPFSESPISRLDEKTDWRYSGIHAMAISGSEYFYTGGGDKLVKAWSLKDYSLSWTMSGHNAVVTSLTVSNGILYSGSWDGTVRLWSLCDHSSLAVIGDDDFLPISSIFVDTNLLIAGHENGMIKIRRDEALVERKQAHNGAAFSLYKKGRLIFSGGLDKTIKIEEMSEEEMQVRSLGSIPCDHTITSLVYWQGKLFVGQVDRVIKVYQF